MGTLNFTVGAYGRSRGTGAGSVMSTDIATSDAYTSNESSATNVEDDSGDITVSAGQIFRGRIDEAAWISFGSVTATVGTGFYMAADVDYEWEVGEPGTVSIIDVA